jgi:hypothetical protein
METWETLTMSQKEAPRAGLVKAALAGQISNAQGAHALRISCPPDRQGTGNPNPFLRARSLPHGAPTWPSIAHPDAARQARRRRARGGALGTTSGASNRPPAAVRWRPGPRTGHLDPGAVTG